MAAPDRRSWSWHYRLLRQEDGTIAVHEVYQDRRGNLMAYKDEPIPAVSRDDPAYLDLAMLYEPALRLAQQKPVLERDVIATLEPLPTYGRGRREAGKRTRR